MRAKYVEECKVVQQNATYTAEAHHQAADTAKRKVVWLEIVPAVCAALTSTLVASGIAGTRILPIAILSATVSAVTAVLNPNRSYEEHLAAGRNFTALKHDARFLWESQSVRMADDAFSGAVENLHQRYNDLLKITPLTGDKAFERARKVVQHGIHEPDRDERGNVR